jgi:hypothetical protein
VGRIQSGDVALVAATIGKDTIAAFYVDQSKPYPKGPVAFLATAGGRHGEFEPVLKNPGQGQPTPHVTYDANNAYVTFVG